MKQKNFKEIYETIYANVGQIMEAKRKSVLRKRILTYLIVVFIWVLILKYWRSSLGELLEVGLVLTILIMILVNRAISKNYKRDFKGQIINEIVKQSNSSFKYNYNSGIESNIYASSGFDHGWDRYFTEDSIEGTMEDGATLKMAQVHTQVEHRSTDSDGHTTTSYVTTFLGLFGVINLNISTPADFMIKGNSKLAKFNKNRIAMESAEFEKYYDVYSRFNQTGGQRQSTMEVLTPETIEEFVKIRNMFKRSINVRVYLNKIYFRIEVGDIFEPPTFKSTVNFDMLYKYFLIIDVPRMLYEMLIDNILVMYGNQIEKDTRAVSKMSDEERKEYIENKKNADEEAEKATYFSHK